MIICQIDTGYWTGKCRVINAWGGVPKGWILAYEPTLQAGESAKWNGSDWVIDTEGAALETSQKSILKKRGNAAQKECSRRIFAVVDQNAQMNLASVSGAGVMPAEQLTIYRLGLGWVLQMRGTWETLAANESDINDDANWPAVPTGVAELGAQY